MNERMTDAGAGRTWVFGYGSLIWKQDFPFVSSRVGRIRGWARRFWQGSHDHRGVPARPGRVVTLAPSPDTECHGVAFLVDDNVFAHLDHREKNGYRREAVDILFTDQSVAGVVYLADASNHAYLGPAPLEQICTEIAASNGPSGSNRDYLLELASALRSIGATDDHVFSLERLLLMHLPERH